MTTNEIQLIVPHSIVLVMDSDEAEIPSDMRGNTIAATDSCVVVGTLPAVDGPTHIKLTNEHLDETSNLHTLFEGTIATPSNVVSVFNTDNQRLLSLPTNEETQIRVSANELRWPDIIIFRVS